MTRALRYYQHDRRHGFALLVTITLVAFLVLVLVALATLTRVETRVAANSRQLDQARQNALFGLNIALGRLQELAGPDQRVTATADLVAGRHDTKRHWTGVWQADPSATSHGKNIGWLVSGIADAEDIDISGAVSATTDGELVTLLGEKNVGSGIASDQVAASTQPIKSSDIPGLSGPQIIGQFAYWVGDEGVKAKANLIDPWKNAPLPEHRYSLVNMQRGGLELVQATPASRLAGAYPANDENLSRVLSLNQLPLLSASADPALLAEATRNRYHDITTLSSTVLADVARGGLKKDLTNWLHHGAPAAAIEQDDAPIVTTGDNTAPDMPQWGMLRSYADTRHDGLGGALGTSGQTQGRHGLAPVLTYFRLGIDSSAAPDAPLKLHLFPTVVLWNPHNVPLASEDSETGDPIVWQVAWRVSGTRILHVQPGDDASKRLSLPLNQFHLFDIEITEPIPPGQSLVFRVKDNGGANPPYTPDTGGGIVLVNKPDDGTAAVIEGPTLSEPDLAGGIRWSVNNTGGDTMMVALRRKGSAPLTADGQTDGEYQAARGIGFSPFASGSSGLPYTQTRDKITEEEDTIGYRAAFTLYARMAGNTSGGSFRWIANQNHLARYSPRPGADGPTNSVWFGSHTRFSDTLLDLPQFADDGSMIGVRASAGGYATGTTAHDLVLREIVPPDAVFTSLAQFQHANLSLLSQYPLYAVGNSLASPYIPLEDTEAAVTGAAPYSKFHDISWLLNRDLWDRYYLSTVPDDLTNADIASAACHLPNARHTLLPSATATLVNGPAAFDTTAAHLALSGGFNVNSTSRQAWRALLAGHLGIETAGTFRHRFSRFIEPRGAVNDALEGHRVLSDDQIESLADKIVDEVLDRGPFLSLADFVNRRLVARGRDTSDAQRLKGALQAAIDNADTDSGAETINPASEFQGNDAGSVPTSTTYQPQFQGGLAKQSPVASRLAFAPGYLTQADLLAAIGPALAARSDTFVIRAYGDVKNPVTGTTEARAWCEAVVQRSPRYVDDSLAPWDLPAAGSDAERFGRRFEIVSFRWLSPDDI